MHDKLRDEELRRKVSMMFKQRAIPTLGRRSDSCMPATVSLSSSSVLVNSCIELPGAGGVAKLVGGGRDFVDCNTAAAADS
jgi:hypothetical protein